VVADYVGRLAAADGRLYLSGLDRALAQQFRETASLEGPVRVFSATPIIGESTQAARLAAGTWLVRHQE
jgi:sulfate permease, SulP family